MVPDIYQNPESAVQPEQVPQSDSHSVESVRIVRKHKPRTADDYSELLRAEKPSRNPMAAFAPKPLKVKFDVQAAEEVVLLLLRQHPVSQLGWVILAILGAFVPLLFSYVSFFSALPISYQIGILAFWYLALFGFVFESFLKWFYNVYIITDERIIDIDFHSLLYRDTSSAALDKIEDTTASTTGFLSSLFDYGIVSIQTAAERREFEFENVPHPTKVTALINDLIVEEEREKIEGRVR